MSAHRVYQEVPLPSASDDVTERPAFLRKLRTIDRESNGWLATCPVHASEGFAVLVAPDESRGRYLLTCLSDDDPCTEGQLLELYAIDKAELRLSESANAEPFEGLSHADALKEDVEALAGGQLVEELVERGTLGTVAGIPET